MNTFLVLSAADHNKIACLENLSKLKLESKQAAFLRFLVADDFVLSQAEKDYLYANKIDWAILPCMYFADLGLIVSDMDSTLITIECIDEIAAMQGLKPQVAEITESAMRGELDFATSLKTRVALLKGLVVEDLQRVLDEKLRLSKGAEFLIKECDKHQVKFLLVSGGFTFFTDYLKQYLNLDGAFANVLQIENGILTGEVLGNIVDAKAKAAYLRRYRDYYGLQKQQVLAMGDGANDIAMLQEAGIAVAYHAKPKTKRYATFCIDFSGLDFVRYCFI